MAARRKLSEIRGTGVRYTLPYFFRFSLLWLLVSLGTVAVASASTFLVLLERLGDAHFDVVVGIVTLQTGILVLGFVALSIFSTHRLAGPIIALRRAFDDVRDGNLERTIRFRDTDQHLDDLARSFNEMVESIRMRAEEGNEPE